MRMSPLILLLSAWTGCLAAGPETGPVIEDYGPVYYVPERPLELPAGYPMKAVFDVAATPDDSGVVNYRLETVARYLNMHARAGVGPERLETVVVLHGRAARSALRADAFEQRYGVPNPDGELIRQLAQAGVRFIVCGQTAAAYGYRPGELAPVAEMSLSALTALIRLQGEGYALIPWGTG